MIGRLAFRSLTAHPVRSAVLAVGFGAGVAVMAILLGVAQVVLQQAQSPALVGGGDVIIRLHPDTPARLVLAGTLQADALRDRVRVAAPFHTTDLFLVRPDAAATAHAPRDGLAPAEAARVRTVRVAARGGIPSLERELGDPETAGITAWVDSPADAAWLKESPEQLLRHIDRFHPIPPAPRWEHSWAEWLYFNGRGSDARFYLIFVVGPRAASGRREASVRLQLDRDGRMETFTGGAELTDEEIAQAPDLTIGRSAVRLDGMTYRISLDLTDDRGRQVTGELALEASPGRLVPPFEIAGAEGWVTGYVVPVLSGPLRGTLVVDGERVSFDDGMGYHDHNWGFWEDVTWQWGQVQHDDLSFIYGRVFPPEGAADPERMPGFLGAMGPDGPIAYATDVRITETGDADGQPARITIEARGGALDLTLRFDVESTVGTRMLGGPMGSGLSLLQMRGEYTVSGRLAERDVAFTAAGAAETWM
jgi:hypothetical protein